MYWLFRYPIQNSKSPYGLPYIPFAVWFENRKDMLFFSQKERANITQWLDSNAFELARKMELKRLTCLLKGMKEIEMFVLISVLVRLAWFQDLPRREYHLCAHPSREGNVTKHAPRWLWLHSRVCLAYQQASRARVLHNHKQDARVSLRYLKNNITW